MRHVGAIGILINFQPIQKEIYPEKHVLNEIATMEVGLKRRRKVLVTLLQGIVSRLCLLSHGALDSPPDRPPLLSLCRLLSYPALSESGEAGKGRCMVMCCPAVLSCPAANKTLYKRPMERGKGIHQSINNYPVANQLSLASIEPRLCNPVGSIN